MCGVSLGSPGKQVPRRGKDSRLPRETGLHSNLMVLFTHHGSLETPVRSFVLSEVGSDNHEQFNCNLASK